MSVWITIRYIEIIRHKQQWGDWGDSITGLNLEQARLALMRLKDLPLHAKNWRPQVRIAWSAWGIAQNGMVTVVNAYSSVSHNDCLKPPSSPLPVHCFVD